MILDCLDERQLKLRAAEVDGHHAHQAEGS
jgi:hypothetical protein